MTVSRSNSIKSDESFNDISDDSRYHQLLKPLWECNTDEVKPHTCLRTLVNFSLGHSFLFPSGQRREVCIADMRTYELEPQGSKSSPTALIITTNNSTVFNGPQYAGCLRARDVDKCPVASIAMYLFSRYHIADAYGNTEAGPDFSSAEQFKNIKLMKGSNSLQAMSYSQQHKSAAKAVELAGLKDSKNFSLPKLLTTNRDQDLTRNDRPHSVNLNNLPQEIIYRLAGFERPCDYDIVRDRLDPPQEVLKQIFPFIDGYITIEDPSLLHIRSLFLYLRHVLVQDMVILKHRYPNNPVSQHPFFNTPGFNFYASRVNETMALGIDMYSSPSPESSPLSSPESRTGSVSPSTLNQDDALGRRMNRLQQDHYLRLQRYLRHQDWAIRQQSQQLQKIQEALNGVQILHSARSHGASSMAEQSLKSIASSLKELSRCSVESCQGIRDLNRTVELNCERLTKLVEERKPMEVPTIDNEEFATKRNAVLHRRLSRNAATLYEMWDDFKSLEQELYANGISTTEWLKVHGSSERQFRHTRMKIIRFVEEEAARRNLPVEQIKHMLYEKMRNRQRPWTIDEVQRQLTAGRRIEL
ncbi:hypothetical protein JA9_001726 [Meyerozyma sp. JA9]|nr:hypothetical protein JA9_001726 [Meyerozyma sp. JA9]